MLEAFKYEQPIAYKIMTNTSNKKRISHAYLIESKGYSKTDELILAFVKYILCDEEKMSVEEKESICHLVDTNNYTELKIINPDGNWIKKEQLVELQKEFSNKTIIGTKKIYVINNAERLNASAANSILKFLEEPADNIIAILVTENQYQLLDTIISRCQLISLNKDVLKKEDNRNLRIASLLFNNEKDITFFSNDDKFNEYIEKAIEFVNYYEKNGIDSILYINNLWNKTFLKANNNLKIPLMEIGLEVVLLYYKDILNYKGKRNIDIFNDSEEKIYEIANKNSIEKICEKIQIIFEIKNKIKYNNNKNLLMDRLLLMMGGVKNA